MYTSCEWTDGRAAVDDGRGRALDEKHNMHTTTQLLLCRIQSVHNARDAVLVPSRPRRVAQIECCHFEIKSHTLEHTRKPASVRRTDRRNRTKHISDDGAVNLVFEIQSHVAHWSNWSSTSRNAPRSFVNCKKGAFLCMCSVQNAQSCVRVCILSVFGPVLSGCPGVVQRIVVIFSAIRVRQTVTAETHKWTAPKKHMLFRVHPPSQSPRQHKYAHSCWAC